VAPQPARRSPNFMERRFTGVSRLQSRARSMPGTQGKAAQDGTGKWAKDRPPGSLLQASFYCLNCVLDAVPNEDAGVYQ
jgi:hypothetical protein